MKYFVAFCYERDGKIEAGNVSIEMEHAVGDYKDITKMEREVERRFDIDHPIIMNYKPLGEMGVEYTRCGDVETLKAAGNSMVFCPHVDIHVSCDRYDGNIGEEIKKMLINSLQR